MSKSNELETKQTGCYVETKYHCMMEAIFATLHKKDTIVIKIKKWQIVWIEGLFRVAIRGIDHQQLLTEILSYHTQAENNIFLLILFHC